VPPRAVVFVLSIVAALLVWELISRTGVISQRDLPAMSTTFNELWSLMQTSHFWWSFGDTVRGWSLGLASPPCSRSRSASCSARATSQRARFRIPIEFLRPIPSAALIPVLFLTLGTT
jgi:NitT/TauT family transport system permease protein